MACLVAVLFFLSTSNLLAAGAPTKVAPKAPAPPKASALPAKVEWKEFVSSDGSFKVEFPGEPKASRDFKDVSYRIERYLFTFQKDDAQYLVAYCDFPGGMLPGLGSTPEAIQAAAMDRTFDRSPKGKIAETKVKISDYMGREISFEGYRENNPKIWNITQRAVLVDRRCFFAEAAVLASKKDVLQGDAKRFFDSLKVPTIAERVEGLATKVRKADFSRRMDAAWALSRIGAPAVPALAKLAGDKDDMTRSAAVYALGAIGKDAAPAIVELAKVLSGKITTIHPVAADALVKIGGSAVAEVQKVLNDKDPDARKRALRILGRIGPSASPAVLEISRLAKDDPDKEAKLVAVQVLGEIGPGAASAIPVLKASLEDRSLRDAAQSSLVRIGGVSVGPFTEGLKSSEPEVRLAAAKALRELGEKAEAAVPALIASIKDPDRDVRTQAVFALGRIGPKAKAAVPALVDALEDEPLQGAISSALITIGPEASIPALGKAIKDKRPQVRRAAVGMASLFRGESEKILPELVFALQDDALRVDAVRAIGAMGPKAEKAVPDVLKALNAYERSPGVYGEAITALQRIGPKAVPALIATLKDKKRDIRAAAVRALASMDPPPDEALPNLIKVLEDEDSMVKTAAAGALERFGPKAMEAMPQLLKIAEGKDTAARATAIRTIGAIGGDARTLSILVRLMKDSEGAVARNAASSLRQLAPKALPGMKAEEKRTLVPSLLEVLKGKNNDHRVVAITVLGEIGPNADAAEEVLLKIADDKTQESRLVKAANAAIIKIRTKPPPPNEKPLLPEDFKNP